MLYDLDRPMNFCNRQILFLRLVRSTRDIAKAITLAVEFLDFVHATLAMV